jgi:transcriptional regulator with PAS, ATPase and Fis domain
VLQDRTIRPVGGATEHRVDVRFVAATNARLDHMVQGGRFRADLYYRLCVFSVSLPPLRARRGDILELADHFLGKHTVARRRPRLSSGAAEALLAFDWPGNIRELENTMLRAINRVTEGTIEVHDLELPCVNDIDDVAAVSNGSPGAYKTQKRQVIEAFERQYLTRLMTAHRGNVTRAARTAGKERRDLGKLLKRHGLDPRLFVTSPQDIADD